MAGIEDCSLPRMAGWADGLRMETDTDQRRTQELVTTAGILLGGAATAWGIHSLAPQVGTLTAAVALGIAAGNVLGSRIERIPHIARLTRQLLRLGVALLGYSLSVATLAALGWPLVAMLVATVIATLLVTTWLGLRLGLPRSTSLLLGAGTSICGASAIAAVEEPADASESDVALAIGMITVFGTGAMLAVPLLATLLDLSDSELAIWTGASIHEVGQVVGAAGGAGAGVLALAVTVKLTRVLMLGPIVLAISAHQRAVGACSEGRRPPLVPLFVAAFFVLLALRSSGWLPEAFASAVMPVQQASLAAAMFGMGLSVQLKALCRGTSAVLTVAAASSGLVAVLGLVVALVCA